MHLLSDIRSGLLQIAVAILLSVLFLSSAPAATLTFSLSAPQGNFNKTYTLSDADMQRLFQVMAGSYNQPIVTGTDAQGNATTRNPSRAEVLTRVFDGLMRGWRDAVLTNERTAAAKVEGDKIAPIAVPTIDVTP